MNSPRFSSRLMRKFLYQDQRDFLDWSKQGNKFPRSKVNLWLYWFTQDSYWCFVKSLGELVRWIIQQTFFNQCFHVTVWWVSTNYQAWALINRLKALIIFYSQRAITWESGIFPTQSSCLVFISIRFVSKHRLKIIGFLHLKEALASADLATVFVS